jgi:Transcriptional regulator, AbiEi antitoxin
VSRCDRRRRALALAARQHGVISRRQLVDIGFSKSAIGRLVRAGDLVRVRPAVFRSASTPVTWEQKALSACIGTDALVALCGRSAAALWDLGAAPKVIDLVTNPQVNLRSVGFVRTHLCSDLRRQAIVVRHGIPVTTLQRTVADLAAEMPPPQLRLVVDSVLSARRVTPSQLEREAERRHRKSLPGAGGLRAALAIWQDGPRLESVAEAAMLRALLSAKLPLPVVQYPLLREGRPERRLDFAWPAARVALEVDGFRWHGGAAAFEADRERDIDLRLDRWTVIRATATAALDHPDRTCAAVAAALSGMPHDVAEERARNR